MGLSYDLSGIKNHNTVCFYTDEKGNKQWNGVTNLFLMLSPVIGLSGITEQNYVEFYSRIKMLERTTAPAQWDEATHAVFLVDKGKNIPVTLTMVKEHIGLKTNVADESPAKWWNRRVKNIRHELAYHVQQLEEQSTPKQEA